MKSNAGGSNGTTTVAFRLLLAVAAGAFGLSFWTSQRWVNVVGVVSSGLLAAGYFWNAYRRSKGHGMNGEVK